MGPERARSPKAVRLRDEFRHGVHHLISRDVFPVEVAHARAERRAIIAAGDGARKLADVFAFMPDLYPYLALLPRAFAVASQARIGVYDCLYVALAEGERCELVTADDKLVRNLQGHFPFIVPLASMP